jgi:hypothetical protein
MICISDVAKHSWRVRALGWDMWTAKEISVDNFSCCDYRIKKS